MSYEVYIDVRHHPRHCDEYEHVLTDAARLSEPQGTDPTQAERMDAVASALRALADRVASESTS